MPAYPTNVKEKRRSETEIVFDVKSDKEPVGHLIEVKVSPEDWSMVATLNWREDRNGYIVAKTRKEPRRTVLLHRMIMGNPVQDIDHISMEKSDNRRENLRIATHSQNHGNKRSTRGKQYKGAYYHNVTGRYQAAITHDGKRHSLGYYDTPEEAARAYDEAARRLFGEFARLNFP